MNCELYKLLKFGILLSVMCCIDKSDIEVDSKIDRHGDTFGEQERQIDYSGQHQEKTVSGNESQT